MIIIILLLISCTLILFVSGNIQYHYGGRVQGPRTSFRRVTPLPPPMVSSIEAIKSTHKMAAKFVAAEVLALCPQMVDLFID